MFAALLTVVSSPPPGPSPLPISRMHFLAHQHVLILAALVGGVRGKDYTPNSKAAAINAKTWSFDKDASDEFNGKQLNSKWTQSIEGWVASGRKSP